MASFKEAFAAARKELGAGKTFTWQGKSYTTDLASEKKSGSKKTTTPEYSPRPKAMPERKGTTTTTPGMTRRGGADTRPKDQKPAAMTTAPKQGKAPAADAQITTKVATRKAAGTPFAPSRANPKVTPLGKSKGIGGRAAEAVKSFIGGFKVNAGKNKTVAKAPNRADVGKAKKK